MSAILMLLTLYRLQRTIKGHVSLNTLRLTPRQLRCVVSMRLEIAFGGIHVTRPCMRTLLLQGRQRTDAQRRRPVHDWSRRSHKRDHANSHIPAAAERCRRSGFWARPHPACNGLRDKRCRHVLRVMGGRPCHRSVGARAMASHVCDGAALLLCVSACTVPLVWDRRHFCLLAPAGSCTPAKRSSRRWSLFYRRHKR